MNIFKGAKITAHVDGKEIELSNEIKEIKVNADYDNEEIPPKPYDMNLSCSFDLKPTPYTWCMLEYQMRAYIAYKTACESEAKRAVQEYRRRLGK